MTGPGGKFNISKATPDPFVPDDEPFADDGAAIALIPLPALDYLLDVVEQYGADEAATGMPDTQFVSVPLGVVREIVQGVNG